LVWFMQKVRYTAKRCILLKETGFPWTNCTFFKSVYYQITKQLFISASTQFIGKRTDNYFDPNTFTSSEVELKSYALLNAYAEYKFLKSRINLFVDAKNIGNKTNFYEVYGYSVQGINVTGGVRFRL